MARLKKRSLTRIRLHCCRCRRPLTRMLRTLPDRARLAHGDGDDYIPHGFLTEDQYVGARAVYVVNLLDVVNSGYTSKPGYGCCGLYSSAMNRRCRCRMTYGWEVSECYMPHGVWLNADLVRLSDSDGLPFEPVPVHPDWLEVNDTAVRRLAFAADKTNDFGLLPILADTLEEAGCGDPTILSHLRSNCTHRGGCYFVDQLLGKV